MIALCATDGEQPETEEGHELVIAGGAERRCSVRKRERKNCQKDVAGDK